jgi:hypothetical protein
LIEAVDIIIEDRAGVIYFITVAERIVSVVNEIAIVVICEDEPVDFIIIEDLCCRGLFLTAIGAQMHKSMLL